MVHSIAHYFICQPSLGHQASPSAAFSAADANVLLWISF